jgi:hypothetical protein
VSEELRIYITPPPGTATAASGLRHVPVRVLAGYLIDHDLRFAYMPQNTGGAGCFTVLDNAAGRKAAEVAESVNPRGCVRVVES